MNARQRRVKRRARLRTLRDQLYAYVNKINQMYRGWM